VPVQVDVVDEASVEAAAAVIAAHLGAGVGLDGVVNNAGILVTPGPVEWTPSSAYKR
jgi:NAD(P)-dependent dehydrogenase (short-subunit alcohol dehydrogenase family)